MSSTRKKNRAGSRQQAAGSKMRLARPGFPLRLPAACCLLPALLPGCAIKQAPPPEPVSHAPLVIDDAMQHRQWPVSAARYANGQTVAAPTGSIFVHRANEPVWQAAFTDTPMFVANVLTIPIVYLFIPPWDTVVYPRGEVEASYHAMPPLPPR